jgi:hypothetical protein
MGMVAGRSTQSLERMEKEEAVAALKASLELPSCTPAVGVADREQFLTVEREKLLGLVIDPIKVSAVPTDWARKYAPLKNDRYDMFAIAGKEGSWLLLDPSTNEFALAYGDPLTGTVSLFGFSSSDALAEWRG